MPDHPQSEQVSGSSPLVGSSQLAYLSRLLSLGKVAASSPVAFDTTANAIRYNGVQGEEEKTA
jgi:hypothetical protein